MPHATLSSTGKGEWLLGIRCTAAIPSHSRTVLAAPQTAGFFHNSAQASEFCLTDQQYLALGEHVPFISVKERLK
ncbi:uncharacterized protein ACIQIH_003124 isoform 4-T5 [Cyanocitta cristata]